MRGVVRPPASVPVCGVLLLLLLQEAVPQAVYAPLSTPSAHANPKPPLGSSSLAPASSTTSSVGEHTAPPPTPAYNPIISATQIAGTSPPPGPPVPHPQGHGNTREALVLPHLVPMKYTTSHHWKDVVNGVRAVDLGRADSSVLSSIKSIFARQIPFDGAAPQTTRNPFHHALDYFLPEQVKTSSHGQTARWNAPNYSTNSIRRSLEVTNGSMESSQATESTTTTTTQRIPTVSNTRTTTQSKSLLPRRRMSHNWRRPTSRDRKTTSTSARKRLRFRFTPTTIPEAVTETTVPVAIATRVNLNKTKARFTDPPLMTTAEYEPREEWATMRPTIETAPTNFLAPVQTMPRAGRVRKPSQPQGPSRHVSEKSVAILHIPAKTKENVGLGRKDSQASTYFEQSQRKSKTRMPVVSKTGSSAQPYLIIPQTGKKIPLTNLSNPVVSQIISAERRQDLKPIGLMIRPIKNMVKFMGSRQDVDESSDSFGRQGVGLDELSLDSLPAGNFVIEFGPPKGDDVVINEKESAASAEVVLPRGAANGGLPSAGSGTSFTSSLVAPPDSVFIHQAPPQIQAALPSQQLSLETTQASQSISSNIQQFQQNSAFPPSQQNFNFRTAELVSNNQPVQAIVNNLQTQSNGLFPSPDSVTLLQPFVSSSIQSFPESTFRLAPPSSSFQSFEPVQNVQSFSQASVQSNRGAFQPIRTSQVPSTQNNDGTFQPIQSFQQPSSQNNGNNFQTVNGNVFRTQPQISQPQTFPVQFQQSSNTAAPESVPSGFGHPQQQSIISEGVAAGTGGSNAGKSTNSNATPSFPSHLPPLTAGLIRYPNGTSRPGRLPWPNVRINTPAPAPTTIHAPTNSGHQVPASNGGKDLESSIHGPALKPTTRRPRFRMPSLNFFNPFRILFPRTSNPNHKREVEKYVEETQNKHEPPQEEGDESYNIFSWLMGPSRADKKEVVDNGAVLPVAAGLTFPASLLGISAQLRNKLAKPPQAASSPTYGHYHHGGINYGKAIEDAAPQQDIFFRTDASSSSPLYYVINPEALNQPGQPIQQQAQSFHKVVTPNNAVLRQSHPNQQQFVNKKPQGTSGVQVKDPKTNLPTNFFTERLKQLRSGSSPGKKVNQYQKPVVHTTPSTVHFVKVPGTPQTSHFSQRPAPQTHHTFHTPQEHSHFSVQNARFHNQHSNVDAQYQTSTNTPLTSIQHQQGLTYQDGRTTHLNTLAAHPQNAQPNVIAVVTSTAPKNTHKSIAANQGTSQFFFGQSPNVLAGLSSYASVPDPNAIIEVAPQTNPAYSQQYAARRSPVGTAHLSNSDDNIDYGSETVMESRMDDQDTYFIEDTYDYTSEKDYDEDQTEIFTNAERNSQDNTDDYIELQKLPQQRSIDTEMQENKADELLPIGKEKTGNFNSITSGESLVKQGYGMDLIRQDTTSFHKNRTSDSRGKEISHPPLEPLVGPWEALHTPPPTRSSTPQSQWPQVTKQYKQHVEPQSVNFTRVTWGFWQAADMDNKPAVEIIKENKPSFYLPKLHSGDAVEDIDSAESVQNIVIIKAIPMSESGDSLQKGNKVVKENDVLKKSAVTKYPEQPITSTLPPTTTYPTEGSTSSWSALETTTLTTQSSWFSSERISDSVSAVTTTPAASHNISETRAPVRYRVMTERRPTKKTSSVKTSATRKDVFIPGFHNRRKLHSRKEMTANDEQPTRTTTTTTTTTPPRTFPRSYYTTKARPIARFDKIKHSQSSLVDLSHFTTPEPLPTQEDEPFSTPEEEITQESSVEHIEERRPSGQKNYQNLRSRSRAQSSEPSSDQGEILNTAQSEVVEVQHPNTNLSTMSASGVREANNYGDARRSRKKRPRLAYKSTDRLRVLLARKANKELEQKKEQNDGQADIPSETEHQVNNANNGADAKPVEEEPVEDFQRDIEVTPVHTTRRPQRRPQRKLPSMLTMRRRNSQQTASQNVAEQHAAIPASPQSPADAAIPATTHAVQEPPSPLAAQANEDKREPGSSTQPILRGWFNRIKGRLASFRSGLTNDPPSYLTQAHTSVEGVDRVDDMEQATPIPSIPTTALNKIKNRFRLPSFKAKKTEGGVRQAVSGLSVGTLTPNQETPALPIHDSNPQQLKQNSLLPVFGNTQLKTPPVMPILGTIPPLMNAHSNPPAADNTQQQMNRHFGGPNRLTRQHGLNAVNARLAKNLLAEGSSLNPQNLQSQQLQQQQTEQNQQQMQQQGLQQQQQQLTVQQLQQLTPQQQRQLKLRQHLKAKQQLRAQQQLTQQQQNQQQLQQNQQPEKQLTVQQQLLQGVQQQLLNRLKPTATNAVAPNQQSNFASSPTKPAKQGIGFRTPLLRAGLSPPNTASVASHLPSVPLTSPPSPPRGVTDVEKGGAHEGALTGAEAGGSLQHLHHPDLFYMNSNWEPTRVAAE